MPENPETMAQAKERCGYAEPPTALTEATRGHYLGDAPWDAVHEWLDANTEDGDAALLVYLAQRYGQTIAEAYAATDSYMKDRLGLRGYN